MIKKGKRNTAKKLCGEHASYMYIWPGCKPDYVCTDHADKVRLEAHDANIRLELVRLNLQEQTDNLCTQPKG